MARFSKLCILVLAVLCVSMVGIAGADPPLITGEQIADDSVTGADVLESSLAKVPSAGTADTLSGRDVEQSAPVLSFDAGGVNGTSVACPSGKFATGGGAEAPSSSSLVLISTMPLNDPAVGWQAIWRNLAGSSAEVRVTIYAICAGVAT